jgi:hypothetical protein
LAKPTNEDRSLIKAIRQIIRVETLGTTPIYLAWDQKIGMAYIFSVNALELYVEHLIYEKERLDRLSPKEHQILTNGIVFVKGQLEK